MIGPVRHLDPLTGSLRRGDVEDNEDHPMRLVTRRAAGLSGDDQPWDRATAAEVGDLFDGLAPEWHTRATEGWDAALRDALDRGLAEVCVVAGGGAPWLEVASGIGTVTAVLRERTDRVVAVDLAMEMLRLAPPELAPRVRADAAHLAHPDGSMGAAVLQNALLFPGELARVLAPGAPLVWVNTWGEGTPIHLGAGEVVAAMGEGWSGVASRAGSGTWCVLTRR